jgi:O-antigen/teichoic acid export membrane protein
MSDGPEAKWYHKLLKENFYGVAAQMALFAAGVAFTLIFPRILGSEDFGYLSLVLAIVGFLTVFGDFWTSLALLKFIPEGEKNGTSGDYYAYLLKLKLAFALLSSAAIFIFADWAGELYSAPGLGTALRIGAALFFMQAVYVFVETALIGLGRTRDSLAVGVVYNAARVLIPLAAFFFLTHSYYATLGGITAAYALAIAFAILITKSDPRISPSGRQIDTRQVNSYLLFGSVGYFFFLALSYSDTLVLGLFTTPDQVGIYRVAWLWAYSTAFLFPFSNRVLLSAHASHDDRRSGLIMDNALRYTFIFVFLMIAGIIAVSDRFLSILYSGQYDAAYLPLVALSFLTLETSLTNLSSTLLIGKGRKAEQPAILGVTAIIQFCLVLVLAPGMGVLGAAVSVAAAHVIYAIALTAIALRASGLRLPPSYVFKPVLCAAAALAVTLALKPYLQGVFGAIALGAAVTAIYLALAVATGAARPKEIIVLAKGVLRR